MKSVSSEWFLSRGDHTVIENMDFSGRDGFKFQLYHLTTVCPCANYASFLSFFPICIIEVMSPSFCGGVKWKEIMYVKFLVRVSAY